MTEDELRLRLARNAIVTSDEQDMIFDIIMKVKDVLKVRIWWRNSLYITLHSRGVYIWSLLILLS